MTDGIASITPLCSPAHPSPANNRLDSSTYNFVTDCDPTTWCNPETKICEKKGCRRDIVRGLVDDLTSVPLWLCRRAIRQAATDVSRRAVVSRRHVQS